MREQRHIITPSEATPPEPGAESEGARPARWGLVGHGVPPGERTAGGIPRHRQEVGCRSRGIARRTRPRAPPRVTEKRAAPTARPRTLPRRADRQINSERQGPMKDSNLNGDSTKLSLHTLDEQDPGGTLEYAAAYTHMGLAAVPNRGKRPLLKGWPSKCLAEDELSRHFDDGQNVGLVNGERSGGLVAVDMDVPEARKVADRFLLKT